VRDDVTRCGGRASISTMIAFGDVSDSSTMKNFTLSDAAASADSPDSDGCWDGVTRFVEVAGCGPDDDDISCCHDNKPVAATGGLWENVVSFTGGLLSECRLLGPDAWETAGAVGLGET